MMDEKRVLKVKGSLGAREFGSRHSHEGGDISMERSVCPDISILNCNSYLNCGGGDWLIHFNSAMHILIADMDVRLHCHYCV